MIENTRNQYAPEQEPMPGPDPWKNRFSGMRCSTCIWFVPKFASGVVVPPNHKIVGRCRRHAPTMNGYPVVYMDDWCGDHRIDENKV
jgi:hypothetical protein